MSAESARVVRKIMVLWLRIVAGIASVTLVIAAIAAPLMAGVALGGFYVVCGIAGTVLAFALLMAVLFVLDPEDF